MKLYPLSSLWFIPVPAKTRDREDNRCFRLEHNHPFSIIHPGNLGIFDGFVYGNKDLFLGAEVTPTLISTPASGQIGIPAVWVKS
jgi:hypothetical protein